MYTLHLYNPDTGHVAHFVGYHPGPGYIPVPAQTEPGTVFNPVIGAWEFPKEVIPAEPLKLNDISIGLAERIYSASTAEEMKAVLMEVLGL